MGCPYQSPSQALSGSLPLANPHKHMPKIKPWQELTGMKLDSKTSPQLCSLVTQIKDCQQKWHNKICYASWWLYFFYSDSFIFKVADGTFVYTNNLSTFLMWHSNHTGWFITITRSLFTKNTFHSGLHLTSNGNGNLCGLLNFQDWSATYLWVVGCFNHFRLFWKNI